MEAIGIAFIGIVSTYLMYWWQNRKANEREEAQWRRQREQSETQWRQQIAQTEAQRRQTVRDHELDRIQSFVEDMLLLVGAFVNSNSDEAAESVRRDTWRLGSSSILIRASAGAVGIEIANIQALLTNVSSLIMPENTTEESATFRNAIREIGHVVMRELLDLRSSPITIDDGSGS